MRGRTYREASLAEHNRSWLLHLIIKGITAALSAAYVSALMWSYEVLDSQLYTGFSFQPIPSNYLAGCFACAIAPTLWMNVSVNRPSQICYWLLYLMVFVPSTFLPFHVSNQSRDEILFFVFILLIHFCGLYAILCMGASRLRQDGQISERLVLTLILTVTLLLTTIIVATAGGLRTDFSLTEIVYDRRAAAAELTGKYRFLSYAAVTLGGCFVPLCVALGISLRSPGTFILGCVAAVALFSFAGTKTDLLTPAFVVLLAVALRRFSKYFGIALLTAAIVLVLAAVWQYLLTDRFELSLLFVRRQLIIPGFLTGCYWDFFSVNPHVYYSDKFLRFLVSAQYNVSTPQLISDIYMNDDYSSANANVWASAFAHAGYVGMSITTLFLGLLLRFFDTLAAGRHRMVVFLLVGTFALSWSNVALETSILSNGVLAACIMLHLLVRSTPQSAPDISRRRLIYVHGKLVAH